MNADWRIFGMYVSVIAVLGAAWYLFLLTLGVIDKWFG